MYNLYGLCWQHSITVTVVAFCDKPGTEQQFCNIKWLDLYELNVARLISCTFPYRTPIDVRIQTWFNTLIARSLRVPLSALSRLFSPAHFLCPFPSLITSLGSPIELLSVPPMFNAPSKEKKIAYKISVRLRLDSIPHACSKVRTVICYFYI